MDSNARAELYTLSIRISADGFCFSLSNVLTKNILGFMRQTFDNKLTFDTSLSRAIKTLPFLKKDYKKIDIIVPDSEYTTVPESFFRPDTASEYLRFNSHSYENGAQVLTDYIAPFSMYLLSHTDRTLYDTLKKEFPSARFHCRLAPLAYYLSSKCPVDDKGKMYIVLKDSSIDVLGIRKRKLLFMNSFHDIDFDNLLYYILGVWKSSGLSQKEDTLFLICDRRPDNRFITRLNEFIKHICEFRLDNKITLLGEEHPDGFEPNMDLSDVSSEILAITLCEW